MNLRKPKTYVLLVIDRSGSMHSVANDVRGGVRSYLDSLQGNEDARYRVTLALFDHDYYVLATDAKPGVLLDSLSGGWYTPRGMTALHYAVGHTITEFDQRRPTLKEGDKVLLMVNTDGQENASHRYRVDGQQVHTQESVKALLEAKQAQGWGTIYMGAGPSAWNKGDGYGYGSSVDTRPDGAGVRATYTGMSKATQSFSRTGDVQRAAQEIDKAAGVGNA